MLRILTLFIASVFCFPSVWGQQTITLPKIGDTEVQYFFITAAAGNLDLSHSGVGAVWDLTEIDPDSIFPGQQIWQYIELSEAPFNDQFPDADFVLTIEENTEIEYNFLTHMGGRLETIGSFTTGDSIPIVLPQPILMMPLPVDYLDEDSESFPLVVDFFDEIDTFTLSISYIADGFGSVILPNLGGIEIENCLKLTINSKVEGFFELEEFEEFGELKLVADQTEIVFLSNDYAVPIAEYSSQNITIFTMIGPVEVPIFEFPAEETIRFMEPYVNPTRDLISGARLEVYPNPTSGELNIGGLEDIASKKLEILVFDLSGKLVVKQSQHEIPQTAVLDLSELIPGIYQMVIRTDEGIFTERVVIAR